MNLCTLAQSAGKSVNLLKLYTLLEQLFQASLD